MNYSDEDKDYFYEEEDDSYEGEDSYHYLEEFISAHLDNYYVQWTGSWIVTGSIETSNS